MPADKARPVAAHEGPPRDVTTFKLRDEWVRLAAVQELSPILRVVGMRLAHFRNGETGQLNPSYATLAKECGTTERTAQKAVAAFRRIGMIADTRNPGGHHDATNDFVLIIPYRRVSKRTPVKSKSRVSKQTPVEARTGVHAGGERVSGSVVDGCPPVHPNSVRNSVTNSVLAAHGERTADADTDSAPISSAEAVDDAPLNQRAVALVDNVATRQQLPSATSIGTDANDASAAPAAVHDLAREVLGADNADALLSDLLRAYDGDPEEVETALLAAKLDFDPVGYIEDDIARQARWSGGQ
ncbi:helix-turn-helix domain-containing protein [Bradyrhizobium tropiciagri]|uniref:helix-turn-helix domain-containing protein n=1 Tax=Bradyrhizobium tropiciagri TaxID=312253 RepID=UPI001BACA3E6|nr:helix-turn-helix domain-containing protein [Bradyrhizobium tropiciagri]MBR0870038.1 helix-turn-helix domain-containing protein [Bradyrhizobium tropiciagri]